MTPMNDAEIVALSKKHTLFEWSAQETFEPLPVAKAKGCYFWTPDGKKYLDFNSQLMCVNIGHADDRVVRAIQQQAEVLPYANPFLATEPRARLGAKNSSFAAVTDAPRRSEARSIRSRKDGVIRIKVKG